MKTHKLRWYPARKDGGVEATACRFGNYMFATRPSVHNWRNVTCKRCIRARSIILKATNSRPTKAGEGV